MYNIEVSVWEGEVKYMCNFVTENLWFPIYILCASARYQVWLQAKQYKREPFWERDLSCLENGSRTTLAPVFILTLDFKL